MRVLSKQMLAERDIVKNPQTKVWGVLGFLSTSKIIFAYLTTKVTSLCKNNLFSINSKSKNKKLNFIWRPIITAVQFKREMEKFLG